MKPQRPLQPRFSKDDVLAEARVAVQIRIRHHSAPEKAYAFAAACWLPEWQRVQGREVPLADFTAEVKAAWLDKGVLPEPPPPLFTSRPGVNKLFWREVYTDQRRDMNPVIASAIYFAGRYDTLEQVCRAVATFHRQNLQFVSKALRSYTTLDEWRYIRAMCAAQVEPPSDTTVFARVLWPALQQELGKHSSLSACKKAAQEKLGSATTDMRLDACITLVQVEEVRSHYPDVLESKWKRLSAVA